MAALLTILALLVPAGQAPRGDTGFLAFANTPRQPGNLLVREGEIGRSTGGRPIELRQFGDPHWSGELLIFGAGGMEPLTGGCPDPGADILLIPDLDPDGTATEARLAGRVIDAVRPAATIRFRRYGGRRPFIHAWRQDIPDAHHGSSFVVELPRGRLAPGVRERLSTALARMGRRVRED
jgi:hypothetical protein